MKSKLDFLPGKKTWIGLAITIASNAASLFLKPEEAAVVNTLLDWITNNWYVVGQVAGPLSILYGLVFKKITGRGV